MLASTCMTRPVIVRLIAVFLLLMTGAELVACEMLDPVQCENFGTSAPADDGPLDDGCICCCAHVVVIARFVLAPAAEGVFTPAAVEPQKPHRQAVSIYHPPKS